MIISKGESIRESAPASQDRARGNPVKGWRIAVIVRRTVIQSTIKGNERMADLTSDYRPRIDVG